ncbi:hypothetical protein OVA24_08360 [Luteolibacter sp. SL250]|uniref:hypothetical protein n=1 Tax=Luteolibacter sp. SL250 TaxID=2995170 RepID=UPI00226FB4A3|nr:hypothetical protein [Luteolibacter sp. SL250]WAC21398.1 hypothetical protein OVA24_08360 [Luteolibacter sp. SL250]
MKKTILTVTFCAMAGLLAWKQYQLHEEREHKKRTEYLLWLNRSVPCPDCNKRFLPEGRKASRTRSIVAGTTSGAAAGGAGGAYAGAGTGVAVGGVGAFPGAAVFGTIGAVGGGLVGGLGGALFAEGRIECPSCKHVFNNPKD